MDKKETIKKLADDIQEIVLANHDGQIKSMAVVWVNDDNEMRVLLTVAANMHLAMVGAVSLLDFELKTMVKKEFGNE